VLDILIRNQHEHPLSKTCRVVKVEVGVNYSMAWCCPKFAGLAPVVEHACMQGNVMSRVERARQKLLQEISSSHRCGQMCHVEACYEGEIACEVCSKPTGSPTRPRSYTKIVYCLQGCGNLPSIAPEYLDKAWPAIQYRSSRWPSFAFQGPTSRARPKLQLLGTLSDVSLECTIGR
jgi:hypothetical protein